MEGPREPGLCCTAVGVVITFGRPFLAPLSSTTVGSVSDDDVPAVFKKDLRICLRILIPNRKSFFAFNLKDLPYVIPRKFRRRVNRVGDWWLL